LFSCTGTGVEPEPQPCTATLPPGPAWQARFPLAGTPNQFGPGGSGVETPRANRVVAFVDPEGFEPSHARQPPGLGPVFSCWLRPTGG